MKQGRFPAGSCFVQQYILPRELISVLVHTPYPAPMFALLYPAMLLGVGLCLLGLADLVPH
jgi:hypothetical protein